VGVWVASSICTIKVKEHAGLIRVVVETDGVDPSQWDRGRRETALSKPRVQLRELRICWEQGRGVMVGTNGGVGMSKSVPGGGHGELVGKATM